MNDGRSWIQVTMEVSRDRIVVGICDSHMLVMKKELQSVRGQLATEQSKCFKLEVRLLLGNLHALNFIFGILIQNEQLDLLLHKYSAAADANSSAAKAGFRMVVRRTLNYFNLDDHDAFAMVYKHFHMNPEVASLLE